MVQQSVVGVRIMDEALDSIVQALVEFQESKKFPQASGSAEGPKRPLTLSDV